MVTNESLCLLQHNMILIVHSTNYCIHLNGDINTSIITSKDHHDINMHNKTNQFVFVHIAPVLKINTLQERKTKKIQHHSFLFAITRR